MPPCDTVWYQMVKLDGMHAPSSISTQVLLQHIAISCHFLFGAEAKSLVLLQKSDTTMALLRAVACH